MIWYQSELFFSEINFPRSTRPSNFSNIVLNFNPANIIETKHTIPEEARFSELYDAYFKQVHDYSRTITGSQYGAEEVTQEVFITLWRKRNDLEHVLYLDRYILRIARNTSFNFLKKNILDEKLGLEWQNRTSLHGNPVQEEMNKKSLQQLIEEAVNALPPQPRKIFQLSRQEQLNFDEIAERLSLSRNTVRNHLNKALGDIRTYLHQNGYIQIPFFLILLAPVYKNFPIS